MVVLPKKCNCAAELYVGRMRMLLLIVIALLSGCATPAQVCRDLTGGNQWLFLGESTKPFHSTTRARNVEFIDNGLSLITLMRRGGSIA